MSETENGHYDKKFYDYTFAKSAHSADYVTEIITKFFNPKSVCDVGCGEGVWLAAYKRRGVEFIGSLASH
jgi:2-polyprenyl-3-methyl-5-hydroxy-6-metoxy-1,4-benzoquinol methylase